MVFRFAALVPALAILAGCTPPPPTYITDPAAVAPPAPAPAAPTIDPIEPAASVDVAPIEEGGVDPALALVEEDPYGEIAAGTGGLTERLPDTCSLDGVQQYRGQSAAAVEGAGLSVPYRVIGAQDIVTQEYNPTRVNFFLDANGAVDRISCG